ncbi:carbonic anhydrase 2-like isoform X2 [Physella acuta]|uniref:carbonic anhydrase 2-like isoform X2 n=1 Tax=Physella acuta TaxID=109671 RepID=UPI0027DAD06B|nr:carbonic anhydrase 2-like isoform X2 [Physella acuta]
MQTSLMDVIFTVVVALLVLQIGEVSTGVGNWNYDKSSTGGPGNWSFYYPDCGGVRQSPINILTQEVLYDPLLPRFDLSDYQLTDGVHMEMVNKGGRTVEVEYTGKMIYIKDGGLPTLYKLDQFHFHWGAFDARGSEHSLDDNFFPMEMHIVHRQNSSNTYENAASHPSGLAVIGFFFKVVEEDNEKLNRHLLQYFSKIAAADQLAHIPTFALSEILPDINNLDYYRYDGSLTTPPCHESVIWSVATEFIPISESQLNMFRNLYDIEHHHLVDDFRPLQKVNHRRVYTTKKGTQTLNNLGVGVTTMLGWVTTSQIILLVHMLAQF